MTSTQENEAPKPQDDNQPELIKDPYQVKIQRALLSVSDKDRIVDFARELEKHNVEILSTGGTASALRDEDITVRELADYTGYPEILDGRVKTLNPKVHGGLLGLRERESHKQEMESQNILDIDLVVVNLYPFQETVLKGGQFDECIENIDIGGPAMIRSAAKNHQYVTVVTDPSDYKTIIDSMEKHGGATTLSLRRQLAANAFAHTAAYDNAVATWFSGKIENEAFPPHISFSGKRVANLRYGENPHQRAAIYADGSGLPGVVTATKLQGKELSYNNLYDTDAAFQLVAEFDEPAVAIIKHANPCGVALGASLLDAYQKALACDPVSAFGGIIAVNRPLNGELAKVIIQTFCEVIIAPAIEPAAIDILKTREKIRVLTTGRMPARNLHLWQMRSVLGGFLAQNADSCLPERENLRVVSDRAPTAQELEDLMFAFAVCKHVKSNAIVFARDKATLGIGAGQMSRLDAVRLAISKARESCISGQPGHSSGGGKEGSLLISESDVAGQPASANNEADARRQKKEQKANKKKSKDDNPQRKEPSQPAVSPLQGSVMASDAFFPFPDAMLAGADAGATAIIHPGGSIKDKQVIEAADERTLAMIMTDQRHFRH